MSAAHSMLFTLVMVPTVWAQNPFPTTPNYVRAYTTGANLFNLGNAQGTSCDMLAIGRSGHAPDGIEKSGLISVFVDVEASSEATYAAYGPEEGASFGDSFTSAGDVFGDGVQDMWVVSPAKAKMYLVNMVAGTELYTSPFHPTVVDIGLNTMGSSILGNVDLDGDGFKDVILGSKGSDMIVMYGTSSGITKAGQQTLSRPGTNVHYGGTSSVGTHIAVGDYDNDGVLDIFACVAVPSAQDNFAAGVISYGRPGRGGWSSEVLADESILGVCVQPRTARINDDDVDDLVVGSATKRNMYVFFGASSRQLTRKTMSGPPSSVSFGKHTAIIDLDHDGQDDLVTCDEAHNSRRGKCYIYNALDLDTPVMTLIGRAAAEEFGSPVVAADLNCDGWDDLAITSRDGGIVSFFQRIPPPTTQPPPPTPVGEGEPGGASPTLFPASTTAGRGVVGTRSPTSLSNGDGTGEGEVGGVVGFLLSTSGAVLGGAIVVLVAVGIVLWRRRRRLLHHGEARHTGGNYAAPDGVMRMRSNYVSPSHLVEREASGNERVPQASHMTMESDDIQLGEPIGQGSFGTVYHGRWNGVDVAVKVSKGSATAQSAMLQEVQQVQSLRAHPNIVQILGVVTKPEMMIITEYMSRGSLVSSLYDEATGQSVCRLKMARKLAIARDIAAGMRHLHAHSVVHRDLAARNVLLDDSFRAKVADFGMARSLSSGSSADTAASVGPVKWMAPEQFSATKRIRYSAKSDVWSFGVTLCELFGETEPWLDVVDLTALQLSLARGESPDIPNAAPPVVLRVIEMCFAPSPGDRATMSAIHDVLQRSARQATVVRSEAVDGVRVYNDVGLEAGAAARNSRSLSGHGKVYSDTTDKTRTAKMYTEAVGRSARQGPGRRAASAKSKQQPSAATLI